MLIIIAYILWYLFHLFCSGWIHDWIDHRSGITSSARQAFIDQCDAQASKGKSKLEIWCGETLPDSRELRKWSRAHAADPAVYDRCLWISRLAELPAIVFSVRCLLAVKEFWGISPVPAGWYIAVIVYDLVLLLLGIRWRRSTP